VYLTFPTINRIFGTALHLLAFYRFVDRRLSREDLRKGHHQFDREVASVDDFSTNAIHSIDLLAGSRFQQSLRLLSEAREYARRVASDPWEFAVDIRQLRRLGLTENDLRFLVRLKVCDQAREITSPKDEGRLFQATGSLSFSDQTCFTLTNQGTAAAELADASAAIQPTISPPRFDPTFTIGLTRQHPFWDSNGRTLIFAGRMVKQFKLQAINQERVLSAFQEELWPKRILDPLCPHPSLDSKRRLSDTIKCLNRRQENSLIRFRGDGTGEGVLWEAKS
jgi:hypothetical protein